ncbi:hypothetical protein, partial [Leclercia adecarboxylata]|uniref:hypothetical protein n=1 Tax=Leclercia adecarboxylata TaxID=83655 RepID=UPI00234E07F1
MSVAKLIALVDAAVEGLAGPGKRLAMLMPCTVSREGDVSDTYLDHEKKSDWQGKRCPMVISWPEGITDTSVGFDTEAGRLLNEYNDIRRKSNRLYGDFRLATQFYAEHREKMDEGYVCSWPDRYVTVKDEDGNIIPEQSELSAQQNAMNLRFKIPEA